MHVLYTNFLFKEFWFFSSPTSSTVAVAMKICSIFLLAAICTTSRGVLPHYLPATRGNALAQDKLIETYINLGFAAQETVLFLASVHGLCFSLGDGGTEMVNVAAIQRFFRRSSEDDFSGE